MPKEADQFTMDGFVIADRQQKKFEEWFNSPEKKALVSEWKNAPIEIRKYPEGAYVIGDRSYLYDSGRTLLIKGQEVMDTCEYPWVEKNVRMVFEKLREAEATDPKILVRGFGLGIDSTLILMEMAKLGKGELHIIELNKYVLENARKWEVLARQKVLAELSKYLPFQNKKADIRIFIHEGDALSVTRNFYSNFKDKELLIEQHETMAKEILNILSLFRPKTLQEFQEEKISFRDIQHLIPGIIPIPEVEKKRREVEEFKFDAIFSDTYPLSDDEVGFNDLVGIEMTKLLLKKNGIFTFFAYYPQSSGGLMGAQRDIIVNNFSNYTVEATRVKPQKNYRYLFHPDGHPVNELPVVLCWNPRANLNRY